MKQDIFELIKAELEKRAELLQKLEFYSIKNIAERYGYSKNYIYELSEVGINKFKEKRKEYYQKNKQRIIDYQKKYQKEYTTNEEKREKLNKRRAIYREKNREKLREYMREYQSKRRLRLKEEAIAKQGEQNNE